MPFKRNVNISGSTSSLAVRLRPAFAGAAATCSGIGLGRFAYVPLFPAMVASGWVSGAEGGLLGALNLAGYLAGVLGGRILARSVGTARALDTGMGCAALAFAGCGWNGGLEWLALWRFVAGVAGGTLMALAGPAVQGAVAPRDRGIAGGIVVSGVAVGVVLASLLVPAALSVGLSPAWLALSALVLLLWAAARPSWPRTVIVPPATGVKVRALTLHLAYGISAAGLVPHMVYFVDLAVRGRGVPAAFGTVLWLIFGAGALAGTLLGGRVADRFGAVTALNVWLALQVAALAAALGPHPAFLVGSAFLGGFAALGLSAVALARAGELAGPAAGAVWVRSTAAFALAQATAGFALAALFRQTGHHADLFLTGLLLSVAALGVSLVGSRRGVAASR